MVVLLSSLRELSREDVDVAAIFFHQVLHLYHRFIMITIDW